MLLKMYQYETCDELINTDKIMCSRIGGYLNIDADQNTSCVFTCSTLP